MIFMFIAVLYGLAFLAVFVLFIIVLVKRVEDKDKETFEKRDN